MDVNDFDFIQHNLPQFFEVLFNSSCLYVAILNNTNDILVCNKKTKEISSNTSKLKQILLHQVLPINDKKITHLITENKKTSTILWKIYRCTAQSDNEVFFILIGEDKTEIEQLKEKNFTLNYILKKVPGYVFWKNKNLKLIGCNETFAKQIGLNHPNEIIGKTDYDLPWEKSQTEGYLRDDLEVICTGTPKLNIIEKQRQTNGKQLTLLTSKVPTYDTTGNISGVLGMYINITELKEKEAALEVAKHKAEASNRAKTNFLAVVSHELRTPLNGILGTTQILSSRFKDPQILEHIEDIDRSANYLLTLVNEVLDVTRIEEGKVNIKEHLFELNNLIRTSIKDIEHRVENKNVELIFNPAQHVPRFLLGDSFRIRQIILNLLGNAIKFTDNGWIKITAICLQKTEHIVRIKISVEDTGIGIDPDMQQKIFERFIQVESDYDRRYQEGSGLGLTICKGLVKAMDGELGLESQIGKGSLFWLEVPFKIADKAEIKKRQSFNGKNRYRKKSSDNFHAHVLLVDDNELNQKIAKILLEEMGCNVDVAADGQSALSLITNNHYDIVFMDIGLPDMDGRATTKKIREQKIYKDLPIVALTAHALEYDIQQCYEASMNDVLIKPVKTTDLKKILKKWVSAS